jgi:hypothetical protein
MQSSLLGRVMEASSVRSVQSHFGEQNALTCKAFFKFKNPHRIYSGKPGKF